MPLTVRVILKFVICAKSAGRVRSRWLHADTAAQRAVLQSTVTFYSYLGCFARI